MEPILEITHVSKTYGKKEALKDVSLKIEPGKVVGLLGPNGSGKSTLIKLINGLLQPTDGQILVAGQALGIEKARQMLATLKIDEDSKLKTLSKGTKEKVQLILVMSRKAKLYILDEPIGGVDPAARDYILNTIIKNYSEESSVIIATHLIQEVENICDDIIFLGYGEVRLQGNVDDIRQEKGQSIDALFREVFRC